MVVLVKVTNCASTPTAGSCCLQREVREEEEVEGESVKKKTIAAVARPFLPLVSLARRHPKTSQARATSTSISFQPRGRGRGRRRGSEEEARRRGEEERKRKKSMEKPSSNEKKGMARRFTPPRFLSSRSSRSKATKTETRRRWRGQRIAVAEVGGASGVMAEKGAPAFFLHREHFFRSLPTTTHHAFLFKLIESDSPFSSASKRAHVPTAPP